MPRLTSNRLAMPRCFLFLAFIAAAATGVVVNPKDLKELVAQRGRELALIKGHVLHRALAVGTAATKFKSSLEQTEWESAYGMLQCLWQFGSMKTGEALQDHAKQAELIAAEPSVAIADEPSVATAAVEDEPSVTTTVVEDEPSVTTTVVENEPLVTIVSVTTLKNSGEQKVTHTVVSHVGAADELVGGADVPPSACLAVPGYSFTIFRQPGEQGGPHLY